MNSQLQIVRSISDHESKRPPTDLLAKGRARRFGSVSRQPPCALARVHPKFVEWRAFSSHDIANMVEVKHQLSQIGAQHADFIRRSDRPSRSPGKAVRG